MCGPLRPAVHCGDPAASGFGKILNKICLLGVYPNKEE